MVEAQQWNTQLSWSMLVAGQTKFSVAQMGKVAEVELVKKVSQEFHNHLDVHLDDLVHFELLLLLYLSSKCVVVVLL